MIAIALSHEANRSIEISYPWIRPVQSADNVIAWFFAPLPHLEKTQELFGNLKGPRAGQEVDTHHAIVSPNLPTKCLGFLGVIRQHKSLRQFTARNFQ